MKGILQVSNKIPTSMGFDRRSYHFCHEGVWVPLTAPISSPNNFLKNSFGKSLSKIINLCTPPFGGDDLMRIPVQNPMGGGDHPGPLI